MDRNRKIAKALASLLLIALGYYLSDDAVNSYLEKKQADEKPTWIDKDAIIERGDVKAYEALIDSVRNDERVAYRNSNFIDYSHIMAHCHDYAPANYHMYIALMSVFGEENTDSLTKMLALYYLKRGADKGDSLCMKEMARRSDMQRKE